MTLERRYASPQEASRLARAVAADHPGFVTGGARGATLRFRVEAPSPASARASLDDLLACVAAAERTLATGRGRR